MSACRRGHLDYAETVLSGKIRKWLSQAEPAVAGHARAVIAPHAGYRYCGHVMAYAYKSINPQLVYVVAFTTILSANWTNQLHVSMLVPESVFSC